MVRLVLNISRIQYFRSFSSRLDRDSEAFASLFFNILLFEYQQKNPLKYHILLIRQFE
jgi:hypothetical protein